MATTAHADGAASPSGPWNPGISSHLTPELWRMCTIFRPENVFTTYDQAVELSGRDRASVTASRRVEAGADGAARGAGARHRRLRSAGPGRRERSQPRHQFSKNDAGDSSRSFVAADGRADQRLRARARRDRESRCQRACRRVRSAGASSSVAYADPCSPSWLRSLRRARSPAATKSRRFARIGSSTCGGRSRMAMRWRPQPTAR